jgi:hypothetical protein
VSDAQRNQASEETRREDSREHDDHAQHRHTTYALSAEHRRKSFEIEDERWERGRQVRDWVILLVILAINLSWMLLVYLLEPGLR